MNRITLTGRLGADPETRRLHSGDPVVNLRLCSSETWKDKSTGERKERTEWFSVVVYNENLCRIFEQHTKKGSKVLIEGTMRSREWEKDGQTHRTFEVVLDRFGGYLELLGDPERRATDPSEYGQTNTRRPQPASGGERRSGQDSGAGGGRGNYDLDDDIPF